LHANTMCTAHMQVVNIFISHSHLITLPSLPGSARDTWYQAMTLFKITVVLILVLCRLKLLPLPPSPPPPALGSHLPLIPQTLMLPTQSPLPRPHPSLYLPSPHRPTCTHKPCSTSPHQTSPNPCCPAPPPSSTRTSPATPPCATPIPAHPLPALSGPSPCTCTPRSLPPPAPLPYCPSPDLPPYSHSRRHGRAVHPMRCGSCWRYGAPVLSRPFLQRLAPPSASAEVNYRHTCHRLPLYCATHGCRHLLTPPARYHFYWPFADVHDVALPSPPFEAPIPLWTPPPPFAPVLLYCLPPSSLLAALNSLWGACPEAFARFLCSHT
jgi:hypothetical protein